MPSFLHPGLLWGLLLLAVPVLIHLINLLRHRRVEWAAMEFLLESQRKNSTWIMLKQLLLLLLRMAAVAGVVFLVAQPMAASAWSRLFGVTKTHHIVLLDDSFSMSDRSGSTTAFAKAKQVVGQIGDEASGRGVPQTFTLLPFSLARRFESGRQAELFEEIIDDQFAIKLESALGELDVTAGNDGPGEALAGLTQWLDTAEDEGRIVYLVTDFRAQNWQNATHLKESLKKINDTGAKVHLVQCVEAAHDNLAITELEPLPGIRAAGVELAMRVTVANYGSEAANNVNVLLFEDSHARAGVAIGSIPPGETAAARFRVNFPSAGEHKIEARLESDAVDTDNQRYSVIDVPLGVRVLIVTDGSDTTDALFLSTALAPGGKSKTGVRIQIEPPRFLAANPLDDFGAIYLTAVARLDQPSIEALESYVAKGGGLGWFLGEACTASFYNERLYREGAGLFPVPLSHAMELLDEALEPAPDLQVTEHPVFAILSGERNSFITTVGIDRYFAVSPDWQIAPDSSTRVIASLRNGAPLAVEHRFGDGRVIAFLTTAGPDWNNWGRNPSYVVAMLEMQAYLSAGSRPLETRYVGTPLVVHSDPSEFKPQVNFLTPATPDLDVPIDAVPASAGQVATLEETTQPGTYTARLTRDDGTTELRLFAYNVEASEGNLEQITPPELDALLEGVDYEFHRADRFQVAERDLGGFSMSTGILYFLVLLLIAEQLLAYSASYHPPRQGGARR